MCDSFTCLAMLTMRGFPTFGTDVSAFGLTISWVMIPITHIMWTCGMFITVLLSCELYSAVCRQQIFSTKRAFQAMGVVGILSILINLPVFWFVNNWDLNCNVELGRIFITIPTLVFRLIIPMVALIVFSFLTIRKVNLFKIEQVWLGLRKTVYFPRNNHWHCMANTDQATQIETCGALMAFLHSRRPYDVVICC